ncbi:afadin [Chanos chanos]|uniref:Afadin n=1 Tax=Chanos chanos TaxID=29144 RepID=A0A6J2W5V1_CHACN|nr:afadin-like [Chanos chanos]
MHQDSERRRLLCAIRQWNLKRPDLFEISEPSEDLVFHGIIRFYHQEHVAGNSSTKCILVSSTATVKELIGALLEKFRLDVRMLSYSIYEVRGKDEERKLALTENPLVVQLNWIKNGKDGRFVLRKDSHIMSHMIQSTGTKAKEKLGVIQSFKRTMSKKDKKKKKKGDSSNEDEPFGSENNGYLESLTALKDINQQQTNSDKIFVVADEEAFLRAVVNYTNSSTVHFKLSPAYAFYLTGRFALSVSEKSRGPQRTSHRVASIVNKMVDMTGEVIQKQKDIAVALAFWLANASELLNFIRQDRDLGPLTLEAQDSLAHAVQKAFEYLSQRLQADLENELPAFLTGADDFKTPGAVTDGVLNTLIRTMGLLRRCRVHPALSIQLFSRLFHFMAAWLLNRLTRPRVNSPTLCSHYWGRTLRQRLGYVEAWAERQGLELAADCHLSLIIQATMLLTMSNLSIQDAQKIHSTCFKLNSLQLRALMTNYEPVLRQPSFHPSLIDRVVLLTESSSDDMFRKEGRPIRLEEDPSLPLPFLLPEEGYSCDFMQGIPPGFQEFLEPICRKGLCTLIPLPFSFGSWTVHFNTSRSVPTENTDLVCYSKPEIVKITLKKPMNSGLGVSIVAAKGTGQEKLGIFIKSVVKGGPAHVDGRLAPGDQLLSVDGQNLVGLSQERAAETILCTGSTIELEIAKLGSVFYGLEEALNQPSQLTVKDDSNVGRVMQWSSNSGLDTTPEKTLSRQQRLSGQRGDYQTVNRGTRTHNKTFLKRRVEFCSNPILAQPPNCGEMSVDSAMSEQKLTSVSVDNLFAAEQSASVLSGWDNDYTQTHHREYLTLPTSRLHGKQNSAVSDQPRFSELSWNSNNMNSLKQACSQEYLSVESERPLVDKPYNVRSQLDLRGCGNHSPVKPVILSENLRGTSGCWKTSTAVHLMASSQPKRIDIPLIESTKVPKNLSFVTFQQPGATAMKRHGCDKDYTQGYTSRYPTLPSEPQPQSHVLSERPPQQQIFEKQSASLAMNLSTFQGGQSNRGLSQHGLGATPKQPSNSTTNRTRELSAGEGLSPDPWRREAREQLEKQQWHQSLNQLEQEVLQLQAKVQPTLEENERLCRLSLELQFQRRLQELQQNGDDEDDDDDVDFEMITQRLEAKSTVQGQEEEQQLTENHTQELEQEENQPSAHNKSSHTIKVIGA